MDTENRTRSPETSEPSPWPGLPALFLGCFGRGAGSKKWSNRTGYGLLVVLGGFAARFALEDYLPESVLDYGIAVAAGAGIGIVYWATWRYMHDLDEMHQRMMLDAIAFSFFTTMTLVVAVGIAGLARNTPVQILLVYLAAEFLRGLGLVLASRRYR
jgi:hypothetical protein